MPQGYFVSRISNNIGRTPEGFLICRDCVIGRTGFQTYNVADLPQDVAHDLGIDLSDQSAPIDLYRHPRDVFANEALSSFEGKPLCDNHPPGKEFVTPDNIRDLQMGHVQNVRRGDEPLESGEWPMLADLVITHEPLLSKVENGDVRELSCGYNYSIARDGEKVYQVDICGNHVAVVPKGRAGAEARINDGAPATDELSPRPEIPNGESAPIQTKKETQKMAKPKGMSWIDYLLGRGLKEVATDADPSELAEAAQAIASHKAADNTETEEEEKEEHADDSRRADDRRADDRRADDRRPADDRRADDRRAGDEVPIREEGEEEHADDSRMHDRRARLHAVLDRMLDCGSGCHDEGQPEPELPLEEHGEDADIQELRNLMDEFLQEEEHEPEHAAHVADRGRAADGSAAFVEGPGPEQGMRRAVAAAKDMLRDFKPHVARLRDPKLTRTYNSIHEMVYGTSRHSAGRDGSYGAFGRAVTRAADNRPSRSARAADGDDFFGGGKQQAELQKMQKAYDNYGKKEGK